MHGVCRSLQRGSYVDAGCQIVYGAFVGGVHNCSKYALLVNSFLWVVIMLLLLVSWHKHQARESNSVKTHCAAFHTV